MRLISLEGKGFLFEKIKNINLVFSTANGDFSLNPKFDNYNDNIEFLKRVFNLSKIFTVSQNHSDIVHICNHGFKNGVEGDGIVTSELDCAVGVFTADCVPILLFDSNKGIVSALHSGWRGTYEEIISNAIDVFVQKYNSNLNDVFVFIGPHNKECCYEVGEDLKDKFLNHDSFRENSNIFIGNKLNMSECIIISALKKGIKRQNIFESDYCTCCSRDVKFYSYRKDKTLNRMFSFIFINS